MKDLVVKHVLKAFKSENKKYCCWYHFSLSKLKFAYHFENRGNFWDNQSQEEIFHCLTLLQKQWYENKNSN